MKCNLQTNAGIFCTETSETPTAQRPTDQLPAVILLLLALLPFRLLLGLNPNSLRKPYIPLKVLFSFKVSKTLDPPVDWTG